MEGSKPTCSCTAHSSSGSSTTLVYAIGELEPQFRSLAAEKEFAQAAGGAGPFPLSNADELSALIERNRHLSRLLCWVFRCQGHDTYQLDFQDTLDARDALRSLSLGRRRHLLVAEVTGTALLPGTDTRVRRTLVHALQDLGPADVGSNAGMMSGEGSAFASRFWLTTENNGDSDFSRAVNYLVVRYNELREVGELLQAQGQVLLGVREAFSDASLDRRIVDVRLLFASTDGDRLAEQFSVRVDVTEPFPFLVAGLRPALAIA